MDLGLKDKVALVAAASKGLGLAVATELAREGAKVVIFSRDASPDSSGGGTDPAGDGGGSAADGGRRGTGGRNQGRDRGSGKTVGRIDVLIANAGGPPGGKFLDFDDGDWEDAFVRNFLSVVRLIRGVLPWMGAGGRIVALASSSVRQPIPGLVLSNAMRAAVAALIKSLAEELGQQGILLNTVGPGRIATDRLVELDSIHAEHIGKSLEEVRKEKEKTIPLQRYGEPAEFARVVAFFGLLGQHVRDRASVAGGWRHGAGFVKPAFLFWHFLVR